MPTELQEKASVQEKRFVLENAVEQRNASADERSVDELIAKCDLLIEELSKNKGFSSSAKKDWWDRLGSVAPIVSGAIIALVGAHFTSVYNQQQLKLQEVQTVERFFPHLMGDERSKRAAILAISSLTDTKLAAKIASVYASEGTASALEKIAQSEHGGNKSVAQKALSRVLDNLAENYSGDKRFPDAENAFKRALEVKSEAYGEQSTELLSTLDKFAELCQEHGELAQAGDLLKRSLAIKRQAYGNGSPEVELALRRLASVYKREGNLSEADLLLQELHQVEGQEKASSGASESSLEPEAKKTNAAGNNSEVTAPVKVPDETGSKIPVIELEPVSNTTSGATENVSGKTTEVSSEHHLLTEQEKHVQ